MKFKDIPAAKVHCGAHPRFVTVRWVDLPESLKRKKNPNRPLLELMDLIVVEWNGYLITINPGLICDLSTIHFAARFIGLHRWTRRREYDGPAAGHDGVCDGTAFFDENSKRNNIMLADAFYIAFALANGANRFGARVRWNCLRLYGTRKYRPIVFEDVDTENPIMQIERV